MLEIGDRVRVAGLGFGVIKELDPNDPEVPYFVRIDGANYDQWAAAEETTFLAQDGEVRLTAGQAAQVREALQALGWTRGDLGPLAEPEKPKKVIKATITLPDDDQVRYARADLVTAINGWNGTVEFED